MRDQLVVDGYNVIYAWVDLRQLLAQSLERARDRLVDRLATLSHVSGIDVTVVFDAHRTLASRDKEELRDGVRVVFTHRGSSADHAIERRAYTARERGEQILVATSDSFHRAMLKGMGAGVIDAAELLRRVESAEAEVRQRLRDYLP